MIKVKWADRIAELADDGTWISDNKTFQDSLNLWASAERVPGHYPCKEAAMLDLAAQNFAGLEVLEYTKPKPSKDQGETVY